MTSKTDIRKVIENVIEYHVADRLHKIGWKAREDASLDISLDNLYIEGVDKLVDMYFLAQDLREADKCAS